MGIAQPDIFLALILTNQTLLMQNSKAAEYE